jgi:predicted dehydrogenase
MMKLGFVGVGPHAQRMAAAFRACGAEVMAHDRSGRRSPGFETLLINGIPFGAREPWRSMVENPAIDAVICCAPPEVAGQIAAECIMAKKTCCATKPLMWTDASADADKPQLYVDLWRLYSPAWLALKADIRGRTIRSVDVEFFGNGPVRSTHSGLLDYGPHALAFLLDLGFSPELTWRRVEFGTLSNGPNAQWFGSGEGVTVETGNGFAHSSMRVWVQTTDGGDYRWSESGADHLYETAGGAQLMQHWRDLALHGFCRAFMAGEPSDTLRISCEAMRLLKDAEA